MPLLLASILIVVQFKITGFVMKKIYVLFFVVLFSGVSIADGDKWHSLSKGKDAHAEGGCASKGKIAQFHKFDHKKGQQVKVPNQSTLESKKVSKEPSPDQFI